MPSEKLRPRQPDVAIPRTVDEAAMLKRPSIAGQREVGDQADVEVMVAGQMQGDVAAVVDVAHAGCPGRPERRR